MTHQDIVLAIEQIAEEIIRRNGQAVIGDVVYIFHRCEQVGAYEYKNVITGSQWRCEYIDMDANETTGRVGRGVIFIIDPDSVALTEYEVGAFERDFLFIMLAQ